jgi:hypothetical protein
MSGIPKRRPNERRQSYRLRCVDAEYTRRDENAIAFLDKMIHDLNEAHNRTDKALFSELVRYYRAKPGTKYDASKRRRA